VPAVDWALVYTAWYRVVLVGTLFAAFTSGFSIRYGMRAAGWPRWTVRLATVVTWTIAVTVASRLLLVPLDGDSDRAIYWTLFAGGLAILLFWAFGLDRTRRAIDRRPTRRATMLAEIESIHDSLSGLHTAEDRERLDGALADLDRYVEPATFELIQLTRSRILSWLDGGPRAAEREERWKARMDELLKTLRPGSSWQPDAWSRLGQAIRGPALAGAPVLGVASGVVLGRSVLSGPIALTVPAAILAGYLLTWRWRPSVVAVLVGGGAGLAATAISQSANRPSASLVATGLVCVLLGAWAALEWRRARRRPDLRLLPPPDAPDSGSPRAS
jgi:hypothetical protein